MARQKLKANELGDCDVGFISLVGRPANRIPFRFTKAESEGKTMLKLDNLNLFAKAEVKPAVVAIIVKADAKTEALVAALKGYNFSVDEVQEDDANGAVIFPQKTDAVVTDTSIIKMTDLVSIAVPKIKGDFPKSFGEKISTYGFYPSIMNAAEIAAGMMSDAVYESASKEDFVQKTETVLRDFSDYARTLISNVPEGVLKMEADDAFKIVKTEDAPKQETKPETEVEKTEEPKEPEATKETVKSEPDLDADVEKTNADANLDAIKDAMLAALAPVTKSISDLNASVEEKVGALNTRLDTVEQVAKSAETVVRKSVLGTEPEERDTRATTKAESEYAVIDTAFNRL